MCDVCILPNLKTENITKKEVKLKLALSKGSAGKITYTNLSERICMICDEKAFSPAYKDIRKIRSTRENVKIRGQN